MKRFLPFIIESTEAEEKQLKHLEHAEDHAINAGHEGTIHAMNNLMDVHKKLRGRKSDTKITMKYDGSPSVILVIIHKLVSSSYQPSQSSIRILSLTIPKPIFKRIMVTLLVWLRNLSTH